MKQEVKRGHYSSLEGDGLANIMSEIFGNVASEGDMLVSSYGAIRKLKAKLLDRSTLWVEMESDPGASNEMAAETIRRYNAFMERATGFTSKQRRNRLNKKAREGKL